MLPQPTVHIHGPKANAVHPNHNQLTVEDFKDEDLAVITPVKEHYVFFDFEDDKHKRQSTSSKFEANCRICLQRDQIDKMIIPCRCLHEHKYVHQECLIQWIIKEIYLRKVRKNDIHLLKCENCQETYKFRMQFSFKSSVNILCQSISQKGCNRLLLAVVACLVVVCIGIGLTVLAYTGAPVLSGNTIKIILLITTVMLALLWGAVFIVFLSQNIIKSTTSMMPSSLLIAAIVPILQIPQLSTSQWPSDEWINNIDIKYSFKYVITIFSLRVNCCSQENKYIHHDGFIRLKKRDFLNQNAYRIQRSHSPSNNSQYLLVCYQQEDYVTRLSTINDCKQKQVSTQNTLRVIFNEPHSLRLKQNSAHIWYFTILSCVHKLTHPLNQKIIIDIEILNNGSHLQYQEILNCILQLIKVIIIIYLISITKRLTHWKQQFIHITITVLLLSLIFSSLLLIFSKIIKSFTGIDHKILLSITHFLDLVAHNCLVFMIAVLLLGWRSIPNRQDIVDFVSPFIICKGTLELILYIMHLRSDETIDITHYEHCMYYSVSAMVSIIVLLVVTVSILLHKNHRDMNTRRIQHLYTLSVVYLGILPILKVYLIHYQKSMSILQVFLQYVVIRFVESNFAMKHKHE